MLTVRYALLSTIWEINDVRSQTAKNKSVSAKWAKLWHTDIDKTWVLLLEKYLRVPVSSIKVTVNKVKMMDCLVKETVYKSSKVV